MAEVSASQSMPVPLTRRKTDGSVILCVEMATLELVQFVGRIAHQTSETTVLTAENLLPTAVVQALPRNATTVKSTVCCGIQSVVRVIIMLAAVFALQTVNTG